MSNFPMQINYFFPKAPSCKNFLVLFFFTVLFSLVLKIFKLELFFEKINSAIVNHFGHIRS